MLNLNYFFYFSFHKAETFFPVDDLIPGDKLEIEVNKFLLAEKEEFIQDFNKKETCNVVNTSILRSQLPSCHR